MNSDTPPIISLDHERLKQISPSLLLGGRVHDHYHHADDDDSQQAKGQKLLIGVLLVLVGLRELLPAVLQVVLHSGHRGGSDLQLHALPQDHIASVQGDLVDLSD